MALLGLVVEEPGKSVSHYAQRLQRRFARAQFGPSTAYDGLPQMARRVRHPPRVRCGHKDPDGNKQLDRYEPTNEGIEAFRAWMWQLPAGEPALREVLYGRLELCQPRDVPRLIRFAREEEAIASDMYSHASVRLKRHQQRKKAGGRDFAREFRQVVLFADPLWWSSRAAVNGEIADRLEELAREAGLTLEEFDE